MYVDYILYNINKIHADCKDAKRFRIAKIRNEKKENFTALNSN